MLASVFLDDRAPELVLLLILQLAQKADFGRAHSIVSIANLRNITRLHISEAHGVVLGHNGVRGGQFGSVTMLVNKGVCSVVKCAETVLRQLVFQLEVELVRADIADDRSHVVRDCTSQIWQPEVCVIELGRLTTIQ